MRLSQRSYPHPVVGNSDDVPGTAFQGSIEMSSDRQQVYLDVQINCSSNTINNAIAADMATFVLHVECSNTFYRRAFEFSASPHQIAIPADNLNDAVEVNLFVRALQDNDKYQVEKAHADYGNTLFQVKRGDILAIGEGQVFHIESSFDAMSRIGSIMHITESPENGDCPMKADFEGDKIVIYLSKKDFATYKSLRLNEGVAGPLTTAIVLPVLIEGIHQQKADESRMGEDHRRWVRIITRKIDAMGLTNEHDAMVVAQRLLELPVRRALLTSLSILEEIGAGGA